MAINFEQDFAGPKKLLWVARLIVFGFTIPIATDALVSAGYDTPTGISSAIIVFALFLGVVALDVFTRSKEMTTVSALYFGVLLGALIGWLFWSALEPIVSDFLTQRVGGQAQVGARLTNTARLLIMVLSVYLAVSTLLQTKDEFRFIIPYIEFSKQLKGAKPLVLDTSVIIDGRIADICDTGIIDTKLIVPRFVLQELQGIADSSDKIRRNRGRRGLDVLKRMQTNPKVEMQMHEGNLPELRDVVKVDERLVVLAKAVSGRVVTNDFNLNKICQLQGVEVINLNELSNALKLVALPGEVLTVKIVKPGDQIGQGIGYLDDGTMVVVEQGKSSIGQEVGITVTSVLQTPAGRMIFGRIGGTGEHPPLQGGK